VAVAVEKGVVVGVAVAVEKGVVVGVAVAVEKGVVVGVAVADDVIAAEAVPLTVTTIGDAWPVPCAESATARKTVNVPPV
jgi:hypothetical protein